MLLGQWNASEEEKKGVFFTRGGVETGLSEGGKDEGYVSREVPKKPGTMKRTGVSEEVVTVALDIPGKPV